MFFAHCLLLAEERVDYPPALLLRLQPQPNQLDLLLVGLGVKLHELVAAIHVLPHPILLDLH